MRSGFDVGIMGRAVMAPNFFIERPHLGRFRATVYGRGLADTSHWYPSGPPYTHKDNSSPLFDLADKQKKSFKGVECRATALKILRLQSAMNIDFPHGQSP